jgi:hypothetical protein
MKGSETTLKLTFISIFFLCVCVCVCRIVSNRELFCWAAYIYFSLALYFSIRDNLPKMVSTRNSVGLFIFTIVFFEVSYPFILLYHPMHSRSFALSLSYTHIHTHTHTHTLNTH